MSLIAVGVTGGIGAYKAVEVVRGLQKHGHDVVVVMTRAAQEFVGPLTFEAITRRRVITDQFREGTNAQVEHIDLASSIALLLVVPATANVVAKFAHGAADDFLSTLYLATRAPVLMAPAMNTNMLEHAAVRDNLARLEARGVDLVDPGEGELACGWIGKGRLAEPEAIVTAAERLVRPAGGLLGRCVLITAGPTFEDLDPVRFLGNRSSGRMGFALAAEAAHRGARVILVAGPTAIEPVAAAETVRVRSAAEMHTAVMTRVDEADACILAAAVADYTVAGGKASEKLKKDAADLTLVLSRTQDILADLGRWRGARALPVLVGFAAETSDVVGRGRAKLRAKGADLIVANDVSRDDAGFGVGTNAAVILGGARDIEVERTSKHRLAGIVLDETEALLAARIAQAAGADRG